MAKIEVAKEIVARHSTEEVITHSLRYLSEARRIMDTANGEKLAVAMGEAMALVSEAEAYMRELDAKLNNGKKTAVVA